MDDNHKLAWKCGVIVSFLITLALSIAALFSTAWIQETSSEGDLSIGLFRRCEYVQALDVGSCTWNGAKAVNLLRASQALYATGSFILFFMAVISFTLLCIDRYTGVIAPVTSTGSCITMVLMIAAVAQFGNKSSEFMEPGSPWHFGWGFDVAITGTCCCAVACIMSFVTIRVMAD